MANYSIRVKQGGTIVDRHGKIHRAGQVIGEADMARRDMEQHIASGYAEPVNVMAAPEADRGPVENPPGMDKVPAVKIDPGVHTASKQEAIVVGRPGGVQVSTAKAPEKAQVVQPRSVWTMNPADLQDKTLEQLNALIQEKDANGEIGTMQTKEDAIALLSVDFVPPTPAK